MMLMSKAKAFMLGLQLGLASAKEESPSRNSLTDGT